MLYVSKGYVHTVYTGCLETSLSSIKMNKGRTSRKGEKIKNGEGEKLINRFQSRASPPPLLPHPTSLKQPFPPSWVGERRAGGKPGEPFEMQLWYGHKSRDWDDDGGQSAFLALASVPIPSGGR